MENESQNESKAYLPVHPELKVYLIPEYYSVPKHYLRLLDEDMKSFGNFILAIRYQTTLANDRYHDVLSVVKTRIEEVWQHYLNSLREGASYKRVFHLRELNRKNMYAGHTIYVLCQELSDAANSGAMSHAVANRRIQYVLSEMERLSEETTSNTSTVYEEWMKRFVIRLHAIE